VVANYVLIAQLNPNRSGYGGQVVRIVDRKAISYADAASLPCSRTAALELDTGLGMGRTSGREDIRRSILPMTGLRGSPIAGMDTNLLSLHR